jgi:hypothetical protein
MVMSFIVFMLGFIVQFFLPLAVLSSSMNQLFPLPLESEPFQ